jgi:hypothetical protein
LAAWSEVSKSCMNGVRRKVRPDCIPDSQGHDTALASITENVTEIAKETGLDDAEFVTELSSLAVTVKSFQRKTEQYEIFNTYISYSKAYFRYFMLITKRSWNVMYLHVFP